jgi:hypothetical protein
VNPDANQNRPGRLGADVTSVAMSSAPRLPNQRAANVSDWIGSNNPRALLRGGPVAHPSTLACQGGCCTATPYSNAPDRTERQHAAWCRLTSHTTVSDPIAATRKVAGEARPVCSHNGAEPLGLHETAGTVKTSLAAQIGPMEANEIPGPQLITQRSQVQILSPLQRNYSSRALPNACGWSALDRCMARDRVTGRVGRGR